MGSCLSLVVTCPSIPPVCNFLSSQDMGGKVQQKYLGRAWVLNSNQVERQVGLTESTAALSNHVVLSKPRDCSRSVVSPTK